MSNWNTEKDIDIAHRLPSNNKELPAPIIIKLVNRHKKVEIMSKAKVKKSTADKMGGNKNTRIFFNDHLTPEKQKILNKAKCLRDHFVVWSRNGEVFCRGKEEGSRTNKLEMLDDIDVLWETCPELMESQQSRQKRTLSDKSPNHPESTVKKKSKTEDMRYFVQVTTIGPK